MGILKDRRAQKSRLLFTGAEQALLGKAQRTINMEENGLLSPDRDLLEVAKCIENARCDYQIIKARERFDSTLLNVTSQVQANNLVKFSQHAKFLGNGLAVIDFGGRVGSIHNSFQAGGNWERELFIESSSFALGAVAGTAAAVNAGGAALGLLVIATPVGWVGLIIGGVAVAGVAAATSIGVNNIVKENSGSWYDSIMKAIGVL